MSEVGSRRRAAENFVQQWRGRGYEKGETHSFWLSLLQDVLGMREVSTKCRFEQRTRTRGFIDVVIPAARTIVEQKSSGVNLDGGELHQGQIVTPFEQAKRYADALPNRQRPDFIIVCNFEHFRIHDLNKDDPAGDFIEFSLAELPEQSYLLDFLIDPAYSRTEKERQVSIRAGELIGKLHRGLLEQYQDPDSPWSQHCLNVLCVRLVFCLFAEDAGLFGKDALLRYLRGFTASQTRVALQRLFQVLDTPLEHRDPYLEEELAVFPYVNGGLFRDSAAGAKSSEDALENFGEAVDLTLFPSSFAGEPGRSLEIPNFTEELRDLLINEVSQGTDWSQISPTVFGGVFESTLNPETRRSGGMHYTSPENIHRVIDPLFLDGLKNELEGILSDSGISDRSRRAKLRAFQNRLASLTWMDSACGSGNFLTETYIEVRRLENQVIAELERGQQAWEFEQEGAATNQIKVNLGQFYGIEINDFAVAVARTALWIAELQANGETAAILQREVADLPLHDDSNIVLANAVRLDWVQLLPAEKCSYLISNPPFIGYSNHTPEQKQDRAALFGKRGGGVLDYVACWYQKAANYMQGTEIRAAFVSTNSICQGQQVTPLWRPLFEQGIRINFAHRSFVWDNEAQNQAHVHVVIIGFSYQDDYPKYLFDHSKEGESRRQQVGHINGYLTDAPDVFVEKRARPLCEVVPMVRGCGPTDGGNLLLWQEEKDELVAKEPAAEKWIRPFSMGAEFINGKPRYCLWLVDCPPSELLHLPLVLERVRRVKEMRQSSAKAATRKKADTPWLFDEIRPPQGDKYIAVPKVSSERRRYIPIGFLDTVHIPGDKLFFVSNAGLFEFGVLTSQFHNAWMRAVAGRLKSDYSYGNTTVYNTFIWPDPTPQQKRVIEEAAALVLEKRKAYAPATLAELYDPDNDFLYPELTRAHAQLDRAVEAAYGVDFAGDETKITAHLFTLYQAATTPKPR